MCGLALQSVPLYQVNMFQSSELRQSVYSFQKSVDFKEVQESQIDHDQNRHEMAIGDLAKRKINHLPYGASVKKPLALSTTQVGLPFVGVDVSAGLNDILM